MPWFVLLLFLLMIAVVPVWPHSARWGYRPAAGLAATILVVLGLWWLGLLAFAA